MISTHTITYSTSGYYCLTSVEDFLKNLQNLFLNIITSNSQNKCDWAGGEEVEAGGGEMTHLPGPLST